MFDSRCWREVLIRAGMTVIIVAVLTIWLGASPWIWLAPPAIAGLVVLKWALRPPEEDDQEDSSDAEAPSGA